MSNVQKLRLTDKMTSGGPTERLQSLIEALIENSRLIKAISLIKLAEMGLYAGQDEMLIHLAENERSTATSIAEGLSVRNPTISKMLDRLDDKGLVARKPDPSDKRSVVITITAEGMAVRDQVLTLRRNLEKEIFGSLDPEEVAHLTFAVIDTNTLVKQRLRRLR